MDITYLLVLQHMREALGGIFDNYMLWCTSLGESVFTFVLMAGIYWCVDKRIGQYIGMNVSFACTANQFLKPLLRVDRPWVRDSRIQPVEAALPGAGGYSFPSGHAARTVAVWGAAGSGIWEKKKERRISVLCWIVTGLILFSRNYLGVHTPQDVLFSLILGIAFLWITKRLLVLAEKKPQIDIWIGILGCVLCFLPMLRVGCLSNAGAGFGFFIGWIAERRKIRFEVKGTGSDRILRFGIGALLLLGILKVINPFLGLFMESKYAGFFTSFAVTFWIMAVYPGIYTWWERHALTAKEKKRFAGSIAVIGIVLVALLGSAAVWQQRKAKPDEGVLTAEGNETEQQPEDSSAAEETAAEEAGNAEENEQTVRIIAHRGYSGMFPENTLASFAGAVDIGADYIELDVQMTQDGQIIVLHDDTLLRTAGVDHKASELTYQEIRQLDAGSWFAPEFAGERIPALSEVLELIQDSDVRVYLELKDIGAAEGFEEAVVGVVQQYGMTGRCVFASFNYEYLTHIKAMDESLAVLYNTTSGSTGLPEEFPAEYYGLYTETITPAVVRAIHEAGKQAYVWTVNTPAQMTGVQKMGVDGIVTNNPGLAKVVLHPEYSYLTRNFEKSITMPGLYEPDWSGQLDDYIVQGLTKAGNLLVISAYSHSGEQNSILYVMNSAGRLQKVVDLGFQAHTGGIAYDEAHDLLWVTGAEGHVYAVSWSAIVQDTYQGELIADFDAELRNHNDAKVASFLTLYDGELFVGSYVNGAAGSLKRYDVTDPKNPVEVSVYTIPERIQGITFREDAAIGERIMLLSQGYQTEDSHLLSFAYDAEQECYEEPLTEELLPEGAEQIQTTADGMYILFESAVRPYRATARIPNDQIYVVRE